jgi:hypothetical protein
VQRRSITKKAIKMQVVMRAKARAGRQSGNDTLKSSSVRVALPSLQGGARGGNFNTLSKQRKTKADRGNATRLRET